MLSIPVVRVLSACTSVHENLADAGGADASSSADAAAATAWASGGTAAMTDKASYPDPFAGLALTTCSLVCETTAGPCTSTTEARQDVSEGVGGLPVRLALKIVDNTCAPVIGAVVEIWHTQKSGVYSGTTPNPQMCEGGDTDAPNHLYFRGTQTTDAAGRVDFDTCFPGWYTSRAIHIHVQVFVGGTEYVTTQLFFADDLVQSICASHPDYEARGQPDTTDATDNVIGGVADQSPYTLTVARMTDGAMMASKVLTIRAATTESVCSVGGM
nr:hypothetical protein [Kofleriaceae bacterium]